jgi:hypothetical protein
MPYDTSYLHAVFYSIMGKLAIEPLSLQFTCTPKLAEESFIMAFYTGRTESRYRSGIVIFKRCEDAVYFMQKIPIFCADDLTAPPIIKGVVTSDAKWIIADIQDMVKTRTKPLMMGYYNPMPLAGRWHVAIPDHQVYNVSPYGRKVRTDANGRLMQII